MDKQLSLYPTVTIKPQTKEELARDYGYSSRTIRRMCHEIGILSNRRLNTNEIKAFYDNYGTPELIYNYQDK